VYRVPLRDTIALAALVIMALLVFVYVVVLRPA
jgi:hypothetical protein